MKKYFYAFGEDFYKQDGDPIYTGSYLSPTVLLEKARQAMNLACRAWERSGLFIFEEKEFGDNLDFIIELESFGYNPAPLATFSRKKRSMFINSDVSWKIHWYQFWRQELYPRIFAHEIGHFLGLGHNSDPESIMYYEDDYKTTHFPTEFDFKNLRGRTLPK